MVDLEDRILIAVPKKGRLYSPALEYLKKIGLKFSKRDRFDIALCSVTPMALIFLPAADIPLYVSYGRVSYGITGQDMVKEHQVEADVKEIIELGFGKCRLCIAGPRERAYQPSDLIGKKVATSFPFLTKKYFKEKLNTNDVIIKEISGSVEIAPTLGTSDVIVDLVDTGHTLKESGLDEIDTILESQAILISRKNLIDTEKDWLEKIKGRFEGVLTAEKYLIIDYNINKSRLKEAENITPGMKAPTIMALEQEGWVAVRSVIKISEKYQVIERLKKVGAGAILVTKMEYFQK